MRVATLTGHTLALMLVALTGVPGCTQQTAVDATGDVVAVVDGDTIDVETTAGVERVRLIGIDTPEIGRGGDFDECYADEARSELDALVYGHTVTLKADPTQDDTDRYGRLLRHVYIDGQSAAAVLIERGAGHEYTYRVPYEGQQEHQALEREAAQQGFGLWTQCAHT